MISKTSRSTTEYFIAVPYGFLLFTDSIEFLSSSLDTTTTSLTKEAFKTTKEEFGKLHKFFEKNASFAYECFHVVEGYEKRMNGIQAHN